MSVNGHCNFRRLKRGQERSRIYFKTGLYIAIERIRNVKKKNNSDTRIIRGATGAISKSFRKYLISIPA
jgi:hypothetical protein